jgi:hypothetical protein
VEHEEVEETDVFDLKKLILNTFEESVPDGFPVPPAFV